MSRVRFRLEFSHEFQTRAHSHRHDRGNVRQNVPEASQAIWFGSRLADERKSFAAVSSLHAAALIYRLANRIRARGLYGASLRNARYFPRATNPRVSSSSRSAVRVNPDRFPRLEIVIRYDTINRAAQLEVPRGMDRDKLGSSFTRGRESIQFEVDDPRHGGLNGLK